MEIFLLNVILNRSFWELTEETPIRIEIARRKWNWIGHILRRPDEDIAKMSIEWKPQGSRRRARSANTWRRQEEYESKLSGMSWNELKSIENIYRISSLR